MNGYLTKSEAAERLGKSRKHVERLASTGKLNVRFRKRKGNRAEPMYRELDVTTEAAKAAGELVPAPRRPKKVATVATNRVSQPRILSQPLSQPLDLTPLALGLRSVAVGLRDGLREGLGDIAKALKPVDPDPCLTIEMAAKYKGVPPGLMLKIVQSRKVKAFKWGRWYVRRSEVDKLDVGAIVEELRTLAEGLRAARLELQKAAGE